MTYLFCGSYIEAPEPRAQAVTGSSDAATRCACWPHRVLQAPPLLSTAAAAGTCTGNKRDRTEEEEEKTGEQSETSIKKFSETSTQKFFLKSQWIKTKLRP